MKIVYIPNQGFQIQSVDFNWEEDRASIRKKLNHQHREDDRIIEMAEYFVGDKSHDIEQRRDIYQDINEGENYFFLSYDKEDKLNELEIHWGIDISIKGIELKFNEDIEQYLVAFKEIGEEYSVIEEGSYLFEKLKMTIENSEAMGGEGNGLAYFYSAKNIEHLLEE